MIELDGTKVLYESNRNLVPDFKQLVRKRIFTEFKVDCKKSDAQFIVRYFESDYISIQYFKEHVEIYAPWSETNNGETLFYASLPFVEVQHQQSGYQTVHAAAVSFPAGAVIILGKEGAGKTTTALKLCRTYGAKLIGNDLVVIGIDKNSGRIMVRGGTKFLHLRYESMNRNMSDLLHLFKFDSSIIDTWLCKLIVDPKAAGVEVEDKIMPLIATYLVHIDNTQDSLFSSKADSVVTRLYLNENFSRYIRGGSISLLGKDLSYLGFVPSYDSENFFKQRTSFIEKILKEPEMLYMSGRLDDVASSIYSRINNGD